MLLELKWNKPFVTRLLGQFVNAFGTVQVPPSFAVEMHDQNEGWVCTEIDRARQLLASKDLTITDGDLKENVQVPAEPEAPAVVEQGEATIESNPAPVADKIEADLTASTGHKCDLCPELPLFPSKRKLKAHEVQAHSTAA